MFPFSYQSMFTGPTFYTSPLASTGNTGLVFSRSSLFFSVHKHVIFAQEKTTNLQFLGVFVSPTTTTFHPPIRESFFTSSVGGFTVVSTIHLSWNSLWGGRRLRGTDCQSTCFDNSKLAICDFLNSALRSFMERRLWTKNLYNITSKVNWTKSAKRNHFGERAIILQHKSQTQSRPLTRIW